MIKANRQSGYTVIELTLSMVFITALLLGIALTVTQIVTAYNRGITVTEVNQAGRLLSDEITGAVSQSGKFDDAEHFVASKSGGKPVSGRLCTGQNTYIWNYADALEINDAQRTTYSGSVDPIYFIKVADTGQEYCKMNMAKTQFTTKQVPVGDAEVLLKPGERELKVYQFALALANGGKDAPSNQELYRASFTIGAGDISAVNATQTACKPPLEDGADPAYCAVQQFQFVIRAGNK